MKTKKLIAALLAVVTTATLFSACGKTEEKKEEPVLKTFNSDNGYTLKYPDTYEPSSMSSQMDFVIFDEKTGSAASVYSEISDGDALSMTKSEYEEKKEEDGLDVDIKSFEKTSLNGTDVIAAEYTCNESSVTEYIYAASDNTYYATYTELPGTSSSFREDMLAIITALKV